MGSPFLYGKYRKNFRNLTSIKKFVTMTDGNVTIL